MKNQNSSDQTVNEDVEALRKAIEKYLQPRKQSFVKPKNSGLGFLMDQGTAKKHNEKLP